MTIKEVKIPDVGVDKVEVTEILVKVGDKIIAEQSLITVEGDKASIEIPAPFSGTIKEIKINIGDKVSAGSLIMLFEVIDEVSTTIQTSIDILDQDIKLTSASILETEKSEFVENDEYIHATPLIRRLARKFSINLAEIKGTGRKGRILKKDIQDYVKNIPNHNGIASNVTISNGILDILPWPKVDFNRFGETEKVKLSRIQKISGENLSRNWIMIPHVTQFDKIDVTDLEAFRKQQNEEAEKRKLDIKFTVLIFVMKAVAVALERMPRFNSSLSEDGQYLTLKKYINIGIAVDTPNGLIVPVLKDVNKKNITELSRELNTFSKKARDGKLTTGEIQGGCFTISNIGGLGTTYFTPIVNAPEVAILGVSKSTIEPIWNGKEFLPRLIMPISLSFDHRVIDGADGVRFITIINNILSDIRRLLV